MTATQHYSVLLQEAVEALDVRPDGIYVDGTFGRGGHSRLILERLTGSGRLLAMDRDPEAVAHAREHFGADARFSIEAAPFSQMQQMLERLGLMGQVNGVLLDLGVSSPQLDQAERGFSFMREGPLDMRMDTRAGETAAQWLARAEENEIAQVLWRLGEERFSRRIARAIVERRAERPLQTTRELAELVAAAVPRKERHKHPATRTFQALRIHLNRELEELASVLEQAVDALAPGGRLVVISFHSLEDRIVKQFMRREAKGVELPPDIPVRGEAEGRRLRLAGKPVKAGTQELAENVRSRSAVMRVAERLP